MTIRVLVETGDVAVAVGLLLLAGADHTRIARWIAVGQERAMTRGTTSDRPDATVNLRRDGLRATAKHAGGRALRFLG